MGMESWGMAGGELAESGISAAITDSGSGEKVYFIFVELRTNERRGDVVLLEMALLPKLWMNLLSSAASTETCEGS